MRRLVMVLSLVFAIATPVAAETAEDRPILAACAAVGGIAAGLTATNPGLAVIFMALCAVGVDDVVRNTGAPRGEQRG